MSLLTDQCIKIYSDFLSRRENLNSSGVSDDFENLQKPDKDCDEWENVSLTESFIASREEENAIDPKFGMKKFDMTAPLSCFSTETGQDAKEEVQEASAVKNTSLNLSEPTLVQSSLLVCLAILSLT